MNSSLPLVEVLRNQTYQTLKGFGGALTQAAAISLGKMTPQLQQEILAACVFPTIRQDCASPSSSHLLSSRYFGGEDSLQYTIARLHISSCDFSVGNYSYDDTPGGARTPLIACLPALSATDAFARCRFRPGQLEAGGGGPDADHPAGAAGHRAQRAERPQHLVLWHALVAACLVKHSRLRTRVSSSFVRVPRPRRFKVNGKMDGTSLPIGIKQDAQYLRAWPTYLVKSVSVMLVIVLSADSSSLCD